MGETVSIWMIGTKALERKPRTLLRNTRLVRDYLMDTAPEASQFVNMIPEAYAGYLSWAKRHVGAEIRPGNIDIDGNPFRVFVLKKGA